MAKLTFPTNPSVNDIYTQDGVSYQWDGSKWTANNDTALTLDAILTNGSSSTQTLTTGAITSPTAAKAWVNFDGSGTVSIRDSYNVSSITDNGAGDYTVNYTNVMSSADYVVAISGKCNGGSQGIPVPHYNDSGVMTETSMRFFFSESKSDAAKRDIAIVCFMAFSN